MEKLSQAKKKKIKKFLKEYQSNKETYKGFAQEISSILKTILTKNSFRFLNVDCREKEMISLEHKLEDKFKEKSLKLIADINDLAGCRIIFYLESDIDRFSKFIWNEFDVIDYKPKYSRDDYNATHFVIKLKEDRYSLVEYELFKDMKCEVQLTTSLYNAWSEMAHDIIYKPPSGLSEFNQKVFNSLEKSFANIMKSHIKEATYSFEVIYSEFQKLKQGKSVFDIKYLENILVMTL